MPGDRVRQLYATFEYLNKELLRLSGHPAGVYSAAGVGVMRLIAFAYLYHYLNWFSKTSIIKWHEITKARAAFIFDESAAAEIYYLFVHRAVLSFMLLVTILHVFLEFPLNHQTLVEIAKSLRGRSWLAVGPRLEAGVPRSGDAAR